MNGMLASRLTLWLAIGCLPVLCGQDASGDAVYQTHCASCHEASALQKIAASNILRELNSGVMAAIGSQLSRAERESVASYLGVVDRPAQNVGLCADKAVHIPEPAALLRGADDRVSSSANSRGKDGPLKTDGPFYLNSAWNGWSPSATNTRFQEDAGLMVDQVSKLKLKWAFGFEGDTIVFSLPSVIGNNVFVGSNSGKVHALDTQTGCTRWTFQAGAGVRSAIVTAPIGQTDALLFGDRGGWFYSLEAETGRLLWKTKVDDHEGARMTGAAVVNDGIVYVPVASVEETLARRAGYVCCTFRGSVIALRIVDGSQVWKTYMIPEHGGSGVAVWCAPTIDLKRGLLYIGTGNNYSEPATAMSDSIVALEMKTGRIAWSRQTLPGDILNGNCQQANNCPGPDYDFGSSPILERAGGRELLLAGQKSGMVYALDPDKKGEIVWKVRVGKGGVNGGVQWGMASDGKNVYAATSDVVRRGAAGYDPKQGGGLTALRISDGEKQWYADPPSCDAKQGCSPAQSAAVTVIPGVVFAGSLDGHLRAYSTEDGRVIWDFDTVQDFKTVNGVKASGGGIDGPGPVVAAGMVFVGSGYARTGGMGGNILLAFE